MRSARPYTSLRDARPLLSQGRMKISHIKRPLSARDDSLKRIIQLIQKTLSKSAQNALNKSSKTQRHPKSRQNSSEFTQLKISRQKYRRQKQFPQYPTESAISTRSEMQKSINSINSTKKIYQTLQVQDFIPYMRQEGNFKADFEAAPLKQRSAIKKISMKKKTIKEIQNQNEKEAQAPQKSILIDKWQNNQNSLGYSFLLDQPLR